MHHFNLLHMFEDICLHLDNPRVRKKPEDTPDKSKTSPPCELEQPDPSKNAIVDDEILALQIKEEDLLQVCYHLCCSCSTLYCQLRHAGVWPFVFKVCMQTVL